MNSDVPESPMQKLARISMDQYTQQMFTEADASFAGTTSFYLVEPPFPLASAASMEVGEKKMSSSNIISSSSLTAEVAEYDDNDDIAESVSSSTAKRRKKSSSSSPSNSTQDKQQPLPMFLTKTYHMIGRCDPEITTWSEDGNSFMIKNVEKFASTVLPQYFKHSNFSSFARQLNFYGFRKLKAEPILTADYDSRTANHMRFFHELFQKDKPELLHNIKRATKSDIQSKDEVYNLRVDVQNLNDTIANMNAEFDMKMSQVAMEFNRKIAHLAGLYDQLRSLVVQQGSLAQQQQQQQYAMQQPSNFQVPPTNTNIQNRILPVSIPSTATTSNHAFSAMQSLHQACMTLQSPAGPQPQHHHGMTSIGNVGTTSSNNHLLHGTFKGTGAMTATAFTALEEGSSFQLKQEPQGGDLLPSDDFQLPPPRVL